MGTLLQRLGGRDAVTVLVAGLFERLLTEPVVAPLFLARPRHRLEDLLVEFLVAHLGGEAGRWRGRDLEAAHVDLAIDDRHFDAFLRCWTATLVAAGVTEPTLGAARACVARMRGRVVGGVARHVQPDDPEETT